jgi:SAM-dependent methyltransferase
MNVGVAAASRGSAVASATTALTTRCAACGGTSERVVWREAGYEGRACACGTVYIDPPPPANAVDPTRLLHPDAFYALPARDKAAWVASVRPGGRLLEVGCGDGHFLVAARARGFEVSGIEPDATRARRSSERLGVPVECGLLEHTTLADATFDIVYHCDLLAHFPEPIAALQRMRCLLRPGGCLCFEVGILGGISPLWYRLIRHLGYPDHRWLYSETGLSILLARSGLRIEAVRHFGHTPRVVLIAVARMLARVTGLVTSRSTLALARFDHLLRYRVGRFAPRVGPRTLFVVAVPADENETSRRC